MCKKQFNEIKLKKITSIGRRHRSECVPRSPLFHINHIIIHNLSWIYRINACHMYSYKSSTNPFAVHIIWLLMGGWVTASVLTHQSLQKLWLKIMLIEHSLEWNHEFFGWSTQTWLTMMSMIANQRWALMFGIGGVWGGSGSDWAGVIIAEPVSAHVDSNPEIHLISLTRTRWLISIYGDHKSDQFNFSHFYRWHRSPSSCGCNAAAAQY